MLEELNADIIGDNMMGHIGADGNYGARPDYGGAVYYGWNTHPFVNMNGERFTDEGKRKYQIYHDILKQPEQTCWAVLGSDDPFVPVLEESTSDMYIRQILWKNWRKSLVFLQKTLSTQSRDGMK